MIFLNNLSRRAGMAFASLCFSFFFIFLFNNVSIAQNIGRVYGTILDSVSNKPIEFATVTLLNEADSSIVGGTVTDDKGAFAIESVPFGQFQMAITFIGYRSTKSETFSISSQNNSINRGKIKISSSSKTIKTFVVNGEKSDYTGGLDKRVYNVDKNIVNAGGTVTDLLQNIPSVSVDINGTVSFRGNANVKVLIDGKESGLTGGDRQAILDMIPLSSIESIEIISNPSANYDAEGMAGIINIITKKDKNRGFNGTLTLSEGNHDKYNISAGLNERTSKFNLYGNVSYRHETRSIIGHGTEGYYLDQADTNYTYKTGSISDRTSNSYLGKGGVDFFLSKNTTLGFTGTYSQNNQDEPENDYFQFFGGTENHIQPNPFISYTQSIINADNNHTIEGGLDFKHTFPNTKKELNISGNYSNNFRHENTKYQNSTYFSILEDNPYRYNHNYSNFLTTSCQADFIDPINSKSTFKAGLKGSMRVNDDDQHDYTYNFLDSLMEMNPLYSDHFVLTEKIFAGYLIYTGSLKFIDYTIGLRTEETLTEINQETTDSIYNHNYLGFFPSASLKYSLGYQEDIQLSYSRRINRPNVHSLNPFKDLTDTMNIRMGNPYLLPEFINSFELNYSKSLNAISITAGLYYKHTDDMISYYRIFNPDNGKNILTFENYSTSENYGAEGSFRYDFGNLGNALWSFNVYESKVNANNLEADLQSTSFNWSTKLTLNIKATKHTNIQITGNYQAPYVSPQSLAWGWSGVDFGIKQDFWKGKASLGFGCSDIFDIKGMHIISMDPVYNDFYYQGLRKRESRVATLTFNYKFGSNNNSSQKKKKDKDQNSDSDNSDEPMGY